MLNQVIMPDSGPPSSSNSSTEEGNQNKLHDFQSFTPQKLTDTFHRLMFTIENGSTIMQGCNKVVSNLDEKVAPQKAQFLGGRKDKVTVELKCAFLEILKIDTVYQLFHAEVLVQAKWQEPALQKAARLNDKSMYDPTEHWIPRMNILNLKGKLAFERRNFTVHFNQKGYEYPVVKLLWRFKGRFREPLELQHFPFDVQDLTIQLSTERSMEEVDFIDDQHGLSTVNVTFQNSGEWKIYEHVDTYRDHTTQEYVSSTTHPILFAQCRVRRKIGFYMWNIIFCVALISFSTFCTATEEPDAIDRMYNNVTLLMAIVVLRLTVISFLPTISYLTHLDVYVLVSFGFMCLQMGENTLMTYLSFKATKEEIYDWDFYAMSAVAAMFVAFHIVFLVHIYHTAYRRRRLMEQKDVLYRAKKDHLNKYGVMMKPYHAQDLAYKLSQLNFL